MRPVIYLAFANDPKNYLSHLPKEERNIREILRERYAKKDHFLVESNSFTEVDDLRKDLTQLQDQIFLFHYSGHAGSDDVLLASGKAKASGLGKMLGELPNLKLVILNGCKTQAQVDLLLKLGVPVVIATETKIEDQLARKFSEQFYESLALGSSIGEAFDKWAAYLETLGEEASAIYNPRDLYDDEEEEINHWSIFYKAGNEKVLSEILPKVEQQKVNRRRLIIMGVLLAIAISASAGMYMWQQAQPFDYVFTVVDKEGNPTRALTGELDVMPLMGDDPDKTDSIYRSSFFITQTNPHIIGDIDEHGNIHFEKLPHTFRNAPLPYRLESHFYQIAGLPENIVLKGDQGTLKIERNKKLSIISGSVKERGSLKPIAGAIIQLDTIIRTSNAAGSFRIEIPENMQKRVQAIEITHDNYEWNKFSIMPETLIEPYPCLMTPKD